MAHNRTLLVLLSTSGTDMNVGRQHITILKIKQQLVLAHWVDSMLATGRLAALARAIARQHSLGIMYYIVVLNACFVPT